MPLFVPSASGGAYKTRITTWTWSSNVTQVAFTNLSGYSQLLMLIRGITFSSSPNSLFLQLSSDNGATYVSTATYDEGSWGNSYLSNTGTGTSNWSGYVEFFNWNNATRAVQMRQSTRPSSSGVDSIQRNSWNTTLAAWNAFKIYPGSAGNITAGLIELYGI